MLILRDASTSTKTAQVSNLQTPLAPRKLLVGRFPQKKACKCKFLVNLAGVPHLSLAQGHQICFIVKQMVRQQKGSLLPAGSRRVPGFGASRRGNSGSGSSFARRRQAAAARRRRRRWPRTAPPSTVECRPPLRPLVGRVGPPPCFHLFKNMSYFPLLVLKGIDHDWIVFFKGLKQV